MNFLIIGDIVGKVGIEAVKKNISKLKEKYNIDFTIANGENSADGMGITKNIVNDLYACGVDAITMGNHTWGKKDLYMKMNDYIDQQIMQKEYVEKAVYYYTQKTKRLVL